MLSGPLRTKSLNDLPWGFSVAYAGLKSRIRYLQEQIEKARVELRKMPQKVPLRSIAPRHEIVRLERERKYLSDIVKMTCYRSETALLNLLSPHFSRAREEGRAFLKSLFQLPADIMPNERGETLTIKFHAMSSPRFNRALRKGICHGRMEKDILCFVLQPVRT